MVAQLSMPSHSKVCLTDGTSGPGADTARCEGDEPNTGSDDTDEPASPRVEFQIELNLHTDEADPPISGWLEACLMRIAGLLKLDRGVVSIVIVDDAEMARLHRQHRQENGTTDVLTFDLRDSTQDDVEGDLVICIDEAARQAAGRGHETRLEVLLYAVHGLLHLLDYDDHNPQDALAMHIREDELLTAIGYGPVYSRGRREPNRGGDDELDLA